MEFSTVSVKIEDHIATLSMTRPPVNALNALLQNELFKAFDELNSVEDVWVVVLYGNERLFSAGADIKDMSDETPAEAIAKNRRLDNLYRKVEGFRTPIIAAINGYALGGGLVLAMACDIRVAAEDAKIGLPEIILGGVAGAGGPQRLTRIVGESKAKQLLFTGDRLSANEANRIGLIDKLSPPGCALDVAQDIAKIIASRPPLSVQALKKTINLGKDIPFEKAIEFDLRFSGEVASTSDRLEAIHAFLERRSPKIIGK